MPEIQALTQAPRSTFLLNGGHKKIQKTKYYEKINKIFYEGASYV